MPFSQSQMSFLTLSAWAMIVLGRSTPYPLRDPSPCLRRRILRAALKGQSCSSEHHTRAVDEDTARGENSKTHQRFRLAAWLRPLLSMSRAKVRSVFDCEVGTKRCGNRRGGGYYGAAHIKGMAGPSPVRTFGHTTGAVPRLSSVRRKMTTYFLR